ncbi:hypothetical protein [Kitasatospora sp. NPDC101183]|uniref:hypothetical protein n=1 Tax=Kitasatospora sp. NPDC101183 TaxID=3364100 RepID=UPI00380D0ED0
MIHYTVVPVLPLLSRGPHEVWNVRNSRTGRLVKAAPPTTGLRYFPTHASARAWIAKNSPSTEGP